jgi:RNA polymerase sigma factor (sigma-70 family)
MIQATDSQRQELEPATNQDADFISLIEQSLSGDHEAFGILHARFKNFVAGAVRSIIVNESDVEDVSQDVFFVAFRKLGNLKASAAFPGWLGTIARNQAINFVGRREKMFSLLEGIADGEKPIDILIREESREQVRCLMGHTDGISQEALHLFYQCGMSIREISGQLSVPEGTVKRRLFVARKRLKDLYLAGLQD